jgi:hypothetical protein
MTCEIQKKVRTRTFSATVAEKIRHPASFNRADGERWCRAEQSCVGNDPPKLHAGDNPEVIDTFQAGCLIWTNASLKRPSYRK